MLNPRNFARLANTGKLTGFVARNVLQAILKCLQMRRTKANEIRVGNSVSRIGDTIPHYEIVTVELKMSRANQRVYDDMYQFYADQLAKQRGGQDSDEGAEPQSAEKMQSQSGGEAPVITEVGIRNNGMHRRLCLMTYDTHLEIFCSRARGQSMAKDIEAYSHSCADDGMTTLFALSCPEIGMLPPIDRFSLGDWLALRSVKLQYICLYMHEVLFSKPYMSPNGSFVKSPPSNVSQPPDDEEPSVPKSHLRRRVLFFTYWPAVLWSVFGFLRNLGLSVLSLRAGMEPSELRESIATFNDPEAKVDAMVASIQFATGLNLHKCCCEMVIVEVCLSTSVAKLPSDPADLA